MQKIAGTRNESNDEGIICGAEFIIICLLNEKNRGRGKLLKWIDIN